MVRLELQADFLAGMWAHYDQQMFKSLENGELLRGYEWQRHPLVMIVSSEEIPGTVIHGCFYTWHRSPAQEWFRRGLYLRRS